MSGYGDVYGPPEAVALWEAYDEEPEEPKDSECPGCGFVVCNCQPMTPEEIAACETPF